MPKNLRGQIVASMFPDPAPAVDDEKKTKEDRTLDDDARVPMAEQLRRCMRLLPHHQNTGGFFVALLRKVPRRTRPGFGRRR